MLFNSVNYLIFFPIIVIIYFSLNDKFKKIFLLGASFFFYSSWNFKYSLLMLLSIVVTFFTGIYIEKAKSQKEKKFFIFLCFFINLGILFLFKYFSFSLGFLNRLLGLLNLHLNFKGLNFLLPVGISFYTFQALGYTIDVYRKEIGAEKNFINYALFVSFFPQLVAGPIERSKNLLPQIKTLGKRKYENLSKGFLYILWGIFLKLVIADRAAIFVNQVYADYKNLSWLFLFIGAVLFSFQIYCDFYSYSIIAKGSAKILGYDLMDNFKEPYLSKSIGEFWKRWHISLSTWFKDYLYIPLGGNRINKFRTYINVLIVFLTSGLWHGANYTFIIWGLIHGIFNILENITKKYFVKFKNNLLYISLRRMMTFLVATFAFIFFRANHLTMATTYISKIFFLEGDPLKDKINFSLGNVYVLTFAIFVLFLVDIIKYRGINISEKIESKNFLFRIVIYILLIVFSLIFGVYGPGYSESQFIYFQF